MEAKHYCNKQNTTLITPEDVDFKTELNVTNRADVWMNIKKDTFSELRWVDNTTLGRFK